MNNIILGGYGGSSQVSTIVDIDWSKTQHSVLINIKSYSSTIKMISFNLFFEVKTNKIDFKNNLTSIYFKVNVFSLNIKIN
jgi:hypothetical protein